MVKMSSFDEFNRRVLGEGGMSSEIDFSPRTERGVTGSFVIDFRGTMNESTANRLKRIVLRNSDTSEEGTLIYLGVPRKEDDSLQLINVGKVKFTFQVFKEIQSVFSHNSTLTEYKIYRDSVFEPFDPETLISTIMFKKPNSKELII